MDIQKTGWLFWHGRRSCGKSCVLWLDDWVVVGGWVFEGGGGIVIWKIWLGGGGGGGGWAGGLQANIWFFGWLPAVNKGEPPGGSLVLINGSHSLKSCKSCIKIGGGSLLSFKGSQYWSNYGGSLQLFNGSQWLPAVNKGEPPVAPCCPTLISNW